MIESTIHVISSDEKVASEFDISQKYRKVEYILSSETKKILNKKECSIFTSLVKPKDVKK